MFERYEQDRGRTRRSRWVRVCLVGSAVAHVAVAVALIVSSWWRIDKLSINDGRPIGVASFGLATAAPPPLASESRERIKKELRRVKEITQNDPQRDRAIEDGGGDGAAGGDPNGRPGGTGTDPNATNLFVGSCGQAVCLDAPAPARKIEREEPPVVPEAMLKGYLIRGNTQIQASDADKVKIARQPDRRVVGVVKLCIDDGGAVTSSSLLKSTGFSNYDRRLVSGVRGWRYKPYRIGGKPAAVCTSVRFVYILR